MEGVWCAVKVERFHLSGPALACALACAATFLIPASARAATITVNSTSDTAANDGVCTLREAIIAANTNTASGALPGECVAGAAGLDTIAFNIAGAGVKTIAVLTPLPPISEAITIDGYTQPGSVVNTNPTSAGTNAVLLISVDFSSQVGVTFSAIAPSTIRGLVIAPSRDVGIYLNAGSNGSTIEGNFIGTNPAGTAASTGLSNANGIEINSNSNVIGGTAPASRNLISGNNGGVAVGSGGGPSTGNLVQGNLIGTDASGTAALPNGGFGVIVRTGSSSTIGGTTTAARNVVSGNGIIGVWLQSGVAVNLVQGNYIGVDVTGNAAIPNGKQGVQVFSAANCVIGGTAAGAGNVISGNGSTGSAGYPNANVDSSAGANSPTLIQGNRIGTNAAGTAAPTGLPPVTAAGVIPGLGSTVGGTVAAAGNIIGFNEGPGVLVVPGTTTGAAVLGNSIFSNNGLGIDLGGSQIPTFGDGVTPNDACDADTGSNNLQNFPVITSAPVAGGNVTISGTLNSTASTTFRIEFFSNVTADPSGNGEGQTFLGFATVTTNASCNGSFGPLVFAVPAGQSIFSATATDPADNTSEFSVAFAAAAPPSADLSVTKADSPDPVTAGSNITYLIGVANGGPSAAANVVLTDTLPANTTFVSFAVPAGWAPTAPAPGGTGTVTATNSSLANGDTAGFTLVVQVDGGTPGGTVISNTASVNSTTADPNGADNSASASTTVSGVEPPGIQLIPTLSPWALVTLTLLLAAFGWIGVARRGV